MAKDIAMYRASQSSLEPGMHLRRCFAALPKSLDPRPAQSFPNSFGRSRSQATGLIGL